MSAKDHVESILAIRPQDLTEADIVYDWNNVGRLGPLTDKKVLLMDETLRDGIQSPSVVDPKLDDKLKLLHLMNDVGVDHTDIGLPGAGPRAVEDVAALAKEIRDSRLRIKPCCAARTHAADIQPIIDISQKVGIEIEVMAFIGSSPVRLYAEDWTLDLMLKRSAEALDMARKANLPVTYVTEDTTRARPEMLDRLFRNAIDHGAHRLCLCDTVGYVTPDGVKNLIAFTRHLLEGMGVVGQVGIDWHGHNDRGLGVTNTLYALEYGADRLHGTFLGVGERVGNSALDQIMVNLKLLGQLEGRDLSKLLLLCKLVSKATRVPIPANYPLVGDDAFRTATGVHAAAIIKAERKGHKFLADRIYSGVPAGMFGREQEIEIGHMSGESNVVYWLRKRRLDPEPALVKRILQVAKSGDRVLTEDEVNQIIKDHRNAPTVGARPEA
jgi:2-isopropylmalate synthase